MIVTKNQGAPRIDAGPLANEILFMSRAWAIWAVALGLIFAAPFVARLDAPEPAVFGKGVTAWTVQLSSSDAATRTRAAQALQKIGRAAAPPLIRQLRFRQSSLWSALRHPLGFLKIRMLPASRAAWVRANAAQALGLLGDQAEQAVPALVAALGDPESRVAAQAHDALRLIGAAAAPELGHALDSTAQSTAVRESVAGVLQDLGRAAEPAGPALTRALNDPSTGVRSLAARALGNFEFTPAIPALTEKLRDPEPRVRENAAAALAHFGPRARSAVVELTAALRDRDESVRVNAANALGKIGPAAATAVGALIRNLEDPVPLVRASSALALGRIGPLADRAVPVLMDGLEDADSLTRSNCATALGKIGPQARQAVPALARALGNLTLGEKICAAEALGRIGPGAREAIPSLLHASDNDRSGLGRYVAEALRRISPGSEYGFGEE